ncbi:MAG: DNA repair protein RecN [Candidatus Omnitrophica bacterium]|nr:DNA repair protein RecN [Candidatus Omnitrophota bacterium]
MLSSLTIQNFGLIDRLSLEFDGGLNILTGETGAGKSIVIGALRIALGGRVSSSQLRDAKKPCVVEAAFDLKSRELRGLDVFEDFLSNEDPSLIIQRTYSPDGRNKVKINGLSVTIGQLKTIGDYLIDFHGPHDHQMLLSSDSHKGMLDRLVDFGSLLSDYGKVYTEYSQLQKKLEEIQGLAVSRDRELDLIAHQVKELEQVPLEDEAYEDLAQTQTKINNAEKLNDCAGQLIQLLEGGQNGVSESIRQSFGPMRTLNKIDERTASLMGSLDQFQEINEQLLAELHDYTRGLSFDPQEAQEVNNRIDMYDDIKKKYGPTLADAKTFYEEIRQKYDLLMNLEHNDSELRQGLESLKKNLISEARKITKVRQKAAVALKQTIEKELSELGIAKVKFEARVEQSEFGNDGQDTITFFISPNAGEDLKPLAQIVSSGEAARVMLALKKALIKVDPIPVLIFDEIDAQIGGRLGTITGKKLREISGSRQVILITHLPQIASFADIHFKVVKFVKDGRALTTVEVLDKEQRVNEIAKMMSGEKTSRVSVEHAHDMLAKAGK